MTNSSRPPLWLAAGTVVAGWGAVYSLVTWLVLFVRQPVHPDFRVFYVASEAGLRFGWPRIYDLPTLRALSASFPAGQGYINSALPFINPPVLAWLITPLTRLPLPAAYAIWSAVSLAALVWAWHISAPFSGLRKLALLLAALAMWPVLDALYFGQPSLLLIGLVATSWWLCQKDRQLTAGVVLAVATAIKPHPVLLLPIALAASGRVRPFLAWTAASLVLATACALALGPPGINAWLQTLEYGQTDNGQWRYTAAYVVGTGIPAYSVEVVQGAMTLAIARVLRSDVSIVFAAGLLGSLVFAFHLHQYDYTGLVLAAWLVLRTTLPHWHRIWLLVGIAPLQALSLGQPLPQLVWDAGWLLILGAAALAFRRDSRDPVMPSHPALNEQGTPAQIAGSEHSQPAD